MQIIISILVVGLLFMLYDILNAPAVDEDENLIEFEEHESKLENTEIPPIEAPLLPADTQDSVTVIVDETVVKDPK
jgi:hypothetical protein